MPPDLPEESAASRELLRDFLGVLSKDFMAEVLLDLKGELLLDFPRGVSTLVFWRDSSALGLGGDSVSRPSCR